jgi:hypothetical protein
MAKCWKTEDERLEDALAYYETGKSFREAEKLTNINYKRIEREAKKRGLEKGVLSQLVTDKARVETELVVLPKITQDIVSKEAELRQKHIAFFNNAALRNVQEAMALGVEGQQDCKLRQETINKGRECVLGENKTPNTAIQINNNSVSLEDLLRDL